MSKLSEQIEAVIMSTATVKSQDEGDGLVNISEIGVDTIPGFEEMAEHYKVQSTIGIRRVYRLEAGGRPYESPMDAFERTYEDMMKQLVPVIVDSFSDGIQMGQENSFPYRKYKMFNRLGDVFTNQSWRNESSLIGLSIHGDPDSVEIFGKYLKSVIGHLGMLSGYSRMQGDQLNKIWDLWSISASSAVYGTYQTGIVLGKVWSENDVLDGILAASEESS